MKIVRTKTKAITRYNTKTIIKYIIQYKYII